MSESFKITKPVRLIETFGGIGSQAMALKRLGVNFSHYRLSEWDVNACSIYKAIHFPNDNTDYSEGKTKDDLVRVLDRLGISTDGKNPMTTEQIKRKNEKWLRQTYNNFRATRNIGSVMSRGGKDLGIKNTDKYEYILCYSFPCQDISLAGRQAGFDEDSKTRSSLLWQIKRLLLECQEIGELPQVLVMENVYAIHNQKNMPNFQKWIDFLDSIGYKSYWQDMNGKDYGVPQNRQRTLMVSLLSDKPYIFPDPIPLKSRMKDYLESQVGEEYYIDSEKAHNLIVELVVNGKLPQREREREYKEGVDLTTRHPQLREVANTIKTAQRGITNFAQDEIGVVESRDNVSE